MQQEHGKDTQTKALKILLSTYACVPGQSSEPGVGWNMVQQTTRFHEVWAITDAAQREAIEREIQQNPIPNAHWIFVDLPRWLTFWQKGERGRRLHYYLWQVAAYFAGKKAHQQVGFDLIHHVTFVSYWTPSFLAQLPVPFIFGPVGGGESAPHSFYPTLNAKGRLFEQIRDAVRWVGHTFDPYVRSTVRRARVLLSPTEESAEKMRQLGGKDIRIMPESALSTADIDRLNAINVRQNASPFRLISMGRLIGWKGFHLGVMAFAQFHKQYPDSEYWIVGDGSQMQHLKDLAAQLGVSDSVIFTGRIPRDEAMKRLADADVLVHPSLHDSGGWVCLEAMAAGRPVICLKLGGPGVQVTEETGFRITAIAPDQTAADLAKAMQQIAENPELRLKMGEAGRVRVREYYDWDKKGEATNALYHEVLAMKP